MPMFTECLSPITGKSAQTAVEETLQYMVDRVGGKGGAVAVTTDGEVGVAFNTNGMAWSTIHNGQLQYGVFPGEVATVGIDADWTMWEFSRVYI